MAENQTSVDGDGGFERAAEPLRVAYEKMTGEPITPDEFKIYGLKPQWSFSNGTSCVALASMCRTEDNPD